MMTNTGIPELSTADKLDYLKDTLVPQYSEKKAQKHFEGVMHDVLKNSWTTSINFMVHNIAK